MHTKRITRIKQRKMCDQAIIDEFIQRNTDKRDALQTKGKTIVFVPGHFKRPALSHHFASVLIRQIWAKHKIRANAIIDGKLYELVDGHLYQTGTTNNL